MYEKVPDRQRVNKLYKKRTKGGKLETYRQIDNVKKSEENTKCKQDWFEPFSSLLQSVSVIVDSFQVI